MSYSNQYSKSEDLYDDPRPSEGFLVNEDHRTATTDVAPPASGVIVGGGGSTNNKKGHLPPTSPNNNPNENYIRFDDLNEHDDSTDLTYRKGIMADHGMKVVSPTTATQTSKIWLKRVVAVVFAGGMIAILAIILIVVLERKKEHEEGPSDLFPIAAPSCDHPIYCDGSPLLAMVQNASIFDDQKTFVDMPIKRRIVLSGTSSVTTINSADELLAIFTAQVASQKEAFNITAFVETYFAPAGSDVVAVIPKDYKPIPSLNLNGGAVSNAAILNFSIGVHQTWRSLLRSFNLSAYYTADGGENDGLSFCDDCHSSLMATVTQNQKKAGTAATSSSSSSSSQLGGNPFVVPGGRFTEYYYWDTYWIIKGLLVSEMYDTTKGMLENFLAIVDTYGFMPNGARVYYLSRSQPPMLSDMIDAFLTEMSSEKLRDVPAETLFPSSFSSSSSSGGTTKEAILSEFMVTALPLLVKEHDFWLKSHHRVVKADFSDSAIRRVMSINANGGYVEKANTKKKNEEGDAHDDDQDDEEKKGTILDDDYMLLNRFYAEVTGPRPESYMEDMATVDGMYPLTAAAPTKEEKMMKSEEKGEKAGPLTTAEKRDLLFSHLAAGAESGYDYTVRWFDNANNSFYPPTSANSGGGENPLNDANYANLSTIQTLFIIPVDLNAILLRMEERIASWSNGDAATNSRTTAADVATADVNNLHSPSYDYLISPRNGITYNAYLTANVTKGALVSDATRDRFAMYAHRRRRSMLQVLMAPPADSFIAGGGGGIDTVSRNASSFSDFNIETGLWTLTSQTERSLAAANSSTISSPPPLPSIYFSGFTPAYGVPSIMLYHLHDEQRRAFVNDMRHFIAVGGAPGSNASVGGGGGGGDSNNSGNPQQWDYANGWAPTQYFIAEGLRLVKDYFEGQQHQSQHAGDSAAAAAAASDAAQLRQSLIQKWVNNCYCGFQVAHPINTTTTVVDINGTATTTTTTTFVHALMEKYHVNTDDGSSGHGGEYSVQLGFGWTNGLVLSLVAEEGSWLVAPPADSCAVSHN